jgi:hypothetical protein
MLVAAFALAPASALGQATADRVTFNKDVLPILQKNCQNCHRPGDPKTDARKLITMREPAEPRDAAR